jgi:hypothetical protein
MHREFRPEANNMLLTRSQKRQFTEDEAAEFLGVSIEQLRTLVQKHILTGDEAGGTPADLAVYQRSDLLLLRLLRAQQPRLQTIDA